MDLATAAAPKKATAPNMIWTLVGAAVCAALLSQRGMGWLLIYVVPLSAGAWLAVSAWCRFADGRWSKLPLARACVWLAAGGIAGGVHTYYYLHARDDAQRVSKAAETFFKTRGTYPCSVRELGFEATPERDHRRLADLYCLEAQPHLWYFSSFRPYEMKEYDFINHEWEGVEAAPD